MKITKIENVAYKVTEFTPRSKKIKSLIFTFTLEGKDYDVKLMNLNKLVFRFGIPFNYKLIGIEDFIKLTLREQYNELDKIQRGYTLYEIEVGQYGNSLIDLRFEHIFMDAAKSKDGFRVTYYEFKNDKYRIGNETYTLFEEKTYKPHSYGNSTIIINELSTKSKEVLNNYRNDFRKQKLINLNN